MSTSRQALIAARLLEEELLFSADAEHDQYPELRLLGFCMATLGRRDQHLEHLPGADIVQLLDYNDIHHRRISAPRFTQRVFSIKPTVNQKTIYTRDYIHTTPYQSLHIAFLPVVADTAGRLHEDAVRLLYHVATFQASGNVDNEGLIGRARQDPRFGYRRASIFRRLQADLGLLLAALGAQQRHAPAGFSFLPPRPRRS